MKKNKGFTLMELLAVIVILGIIATIATPIVINVINTSRESANRNSVTFYGKAIDNAVKTYMASNNGKVPKGSFKSEGKKIVSGTYTLDIDYKGNDISCNVINISVDGEVYLSGCKIGKNYIYQEGSKTEYFTYGSIIPSPEEWFAFDAEYGIITGFSDAYDGTTDIVIPSTINGVAVTETGVGSFSKTELTSVVISEGITRVNSGSFHNCSSLSSVTLPSTLTEIDSQVFENTAITEIVLPEGLTMLNMASFKGSSLQKINIPSGIEMIATELFMNTQLETIIIPEGIVYIGEDAFSGTNITSVTLPSTVEYMNNNAFTNMTSVTIKGKSSFEDFGRCLDGAISWAEGYSDENIIWEP